MNILVDDRASAILNFLRRYEGTEYLDAIERMMQAQCPQGVRTVSPRLVQDLSRLAGDSHFDEAAWREEIEAIVCGSTEALLDLGFDRCDEVRIVLCVGGAFDGKSSGKTIYLSVDLIARESLQSLVVHELAHVMTPKRILDQLPCELDVRLIAEAFAIWASITLANCGVSAAIQIEDQQLDVIREQTSLLLEEFRTARLGMVNDPCFPSDPFLGGTQGEFERYGYFVAYLFCNYYNSSELSGMLRGEVRASNALVKFLGLHEHWPKSIIDPDGKAVLQTSPAYDKLAFARGKSWNGGFQSEARLKKVLGSLERKFDSILDVGCGTGHLLDSLYAYGNSRTGIDRSAGMIGLARQRSSKIKWVNEDVENWNCNESYELVISMFDTVNHLAADQDPKTFVPLLAKFVSRKGGVLIFDFVTPSGMSRIQPLRTRVNGDWKMVDIFDWNEHLNLGRSRAYVINVQEPDCCYFEEISELSLEPDGIAKQLSLHGFNQIELYNFDTLRHLNGEEPNRILAVAQR